MNPCITRESKWKRGRGREHGRVREGGNGGEQRAVVEVGLLLLPRSTARGLFGFGSPWLFGLKSFGEVEGIAEKRLGKDGGLRSADQNVVELGALRCE